MKRFAQGAQARFVEGLAQGRVSMDGAADILQPRPHLQREAEGGRVQSLKQFASRMLPDMQERLSLATQTAGSVGADVTASSSEAREGSASY